MKFKPHYSGNSSKKFWQEVNSFCDSGDFHVQQSLYALGCILQNTEEKVLRELNDHLKLRKKGYYR